MKASILFTLILVFLFVVAYYIVEIGKRNAQRAAEYNKRFAILKVVIATYKITEKTYWDIKIGIGLLRELKHKEPERTDLLETEFLNRYENLIKELRSENEFSPENTFGK